MRGDEARRVEEEGDARLVLVHRRVVEDERGERVDPPRLEPLPPRVRHRDEAGVGQVAARLLPELPEEPVRVAVDAFEVRPSGAGLERRQLHPGERRLELAFLGEVDRGAVGELLRPRVDDLSRDLPHRPARLQRGPGSLRDAVGEHREDERSLGRRQDPRVGPHAVHRSGLSGPAGPGAGEEEARDPVPRSRVLRQAKREAARLLVEERSGGGPAPELGGVARGHPAERLPGLVRLARAEARNPPDELDPGEAEPPPCGSSPPPRRRRR